MKRTLYRRLLNAMQDRKTPISAAQPHFAKRWANVFKRQQEVLPRIRLDLQRLRPPTKFEPHSAPLKAPKIRLMPREKYR